MNLRRPNKPAKHKKLAFLFAGLFLIFIFFAWFMLGPFKFMLTKTGAFTGFPFGNRSYIVLFQNNYELRPTGGFISNYGVLRFKHGIYAGMDFHDVYGEIDEHPYVQPPLALSALLDGEGYQGHSFRDANFNPDFSLAKTDITEFYNMIYPDQRIDGVIAVDFYFLETLLKKYEPLKVEEYEFTSENLFETLSAIASDIDRHNEESLANRKNIVTPFVKKLIYKSVMPWRVRGVLRTVEQGFEEKHVLASFNRKRLEKAFAKRAWNGAFPTLGSGDFLTINDANYGGMKSNRYITRKVKYLVDVTNETDALGNPIVKADLQITLSHEGIWNIPLSGAYTGYLRTFIPLGSDIETQSDLIESGEKFTSIAEFVNLEPGESVTYNYKYELPEYVWQDDSYNLFLNKQPGTIDDFYELIVRVPQGKSLDSELLTVKENIGFFKGNLTEDLLLNFSMKEDIMPPRVVSHEVTALNEITIVFNEALAPDYAGDPLLYRITDSDFTNTEVTDQIVIQNIRVDGSAVIIQTSGMSLQPEERYLVEMRDIKDTSSNTITPNPRTLTVVQKDVEPEEEPEPEAEITEENETTE